MGKAKLYIPASDNIGETEFDGLSDELAMTTARTAAMTLSDDNHRPVVVTLESGKILLMSYDTMRETIIIGAPALDMEKVRECGGFREYAQSVGGPIL